MTITNDVDDNNVSTTNQGETAMNGKKYKIKSKIDLDRLKSRYAISS